MPQATRGVGWAGTKCPRELKGSCPQGADSVLWSELGYNSAMEQDFKDNPILNSPYHKPNKHWRLDSTGYPTGKLANERRESRHFVPIPPSERKRRRVELPFEEKSESNALINDIREQVDKWREQPKEKWDVTYATERLLEHWRGGQTKPRLFFCQVEAAETFIWLNEVAPHTAAGKRILERLRKANEIANSQFLRYATKMATGSGKTMVMAMLIAYHTINKSRLPKSPRFSNSFLIITPGITIKDRLRVLLPSDPSKMYRQRCIVPDEFMEEIQKAKIVITNYHTFKQRKKMKISGAEQKVLKGNSNAWEFMIESKGQMLARACKELLHSGDVIVINDEAHHCYRKIEGNLDENVKSKKREKISPEEKEEIEKNDAAARLWISGIETLGEKVRLKCVYDLSATPFFLRGSGDLDGKLFPWVTSDFALMDAIESGIVKLPRVPTKDSARMPDGEPMHRTLYPYVKKDLPKNKVKDPEYLPSELESALVTLYDHYRKTYKEWDKVRTPVPPVFIIVCNNTSTSKLIYDYISGYKTEHSKTWKVGKLPLFSNVDKNGNPLSRMNTLLIDSAQIDSGEGMNKEFKEVAKEEIENFKNDRRKRFPDRDTEKLTDEDLLREVMNTVGKPGELGGQIRCVVSVSMLTEGWDANNVTHILGVRAFGTQLLCEQVVGRALRRYNYDLETEGENAGRFAPEIADIFGVPFTIARGTKVKKRKPPKPQHHVRAIDEREHLEIVFPNVCAYTVKIPDKKLIANFDKDSDLEIKPEDAPAYTQQEAIIGETEDLTMDDLHERRINHLVFYLAAETSKLFKDEEGFVAPSVFRDLVPITRYWVENHLKCYDDTFPQYLFLGEFREKAKQCIYRACATKKDGRKDNKDEMRIPIVNAYTPEGSTAKVGFHTTKQLLYKTDPNKCHVNLAVCDSEWEMRFCEFLEENPNVYSYVRNDGLGFEVPYIYEQKDRSYEPDFILQVNDGKGKDDLLNLVVEIKGFRSREDSVKADTIKKLWIRSVNNDGRWGRWAFVEITKMEHARKKLTQFTASKNDD